jgi:hypothetical protein
MTEEIVHITWFPNIGSQRTALHFGLESLEGKLIACLTYGGAVFFHKFCIVVTFAQDCPIGAMFLVELASVLKAGVHFHGLLAVGFRIFDAFLHFISSLLVNVLLNSQGSLIGVYSFFDRELATCLTHGSTVLLHRVGKGFTIAHNCPKGAVLVLEFAGFFKARVFLHDTLDVLSCIFNNLHNFVGSR